MNHRKQNNSLWYRIELTMLLIATFFIISTVATFARYRSEIQKDIAYSVRVPDQICLGTIEMVPEDVLQEDPEELPSDATDQPGSTEEITSATEGIELAEETLPVSLKETFVPSDGINWEVQNGVARLEFAVANGNAEDNFSERDQMFAVRLIGSLGVFNGTEIAKVQLVRSLSENPEDTELLEATVTQINKETPLYTAFGEGWIFTFLDEQGEELLWRLNGGSFNFTEVTITIENARMTDPSLLQLQVVANP